MCVCLCVCAWRAYACVYVRAIAYDDVILCACDGVRVSGRECVFVLVCVCAIRVCESVWIPDQLK